MKLLIGVISFILVIFTKPVDLAWRFREGAVQVHPDPILLKVYFCELEPGHVYLMSQGLIKAVVDETHQYIIGIIQGNRVCPLLVQKWYRDPRHPETDLLRYQQVKVLLNGCPVFNVTEEILEGDPLKNKFWKGFKESRVIYVKIPNL
ncbi:uncharacterized protein LOC117169315 [Belonocnema kinseyi]|uniref:uncharacterized protein LOC117169315 n=1 Tax=Belonocnema kinseyi TaxID=2817044 RepID=UPI00143DB219|nr:uncharacterized protein LOC117169315 [Belonocnema kinseyi]